MVAPGLSYDSRLFLTPPPPGAYVFEIFEGFYVPLATDECIELLMWFN